MLSRAILTVMLCWAGTAAGETLYAYASIALLSEPTHPADVLGHLAVGERGKVVERARGWARLEANGVTGWAQLMFLGAEEPTVRRLLERAADPKLDADWRSIWAYAAVGLDPTSTAAHQLARALFVETERAAAARREKAPDERPLVYECESGDHRACLGRTLAGTAVNDSAPFVVFSAIPDCRGPYVVHVVGAPKRSGKNRWEAEVLRRTVNAHDSLYTAIYGRTPPEQPSCDEVALMAAVEKNELPMKWHVLHARHDGGNGLVRRRGCDDGVIELRGSSRETLHLVYGRHDYAVSGLQLDGGVVTLDLENDARCTIAWPIRAGRPWVGLISCPEFPETYVTPGYHLERFPLAAAPCATTPAAAGRSR